LDAILSKTTQEAVEPALGIAAVERETGLSKDLLRVWERRYGFPQPQRDAQAERLYPLEQVQRLRWIKRLLDQGARPGQVVSLPPDALQKCLEALGKEGAGAVHRSTQDEDRERQRERVEDLLAPLFVHQPTRLLEGLQAELLRLGLSTYVTERLAPLVQRVGELWSQGRLQVFEEHLFTEVVQQQLRGALAQLRSSGGERPLVLLTTVPGEEHSLGLLMAHALLAVQGCACMSLGLQTPLPDIVQALRARRSDVLALSFSSFASAALLSDSLDYLARHGPQETPIWVGGRAAALPRLVSRWPGRVRHLAALEDVGAAVQAWRQSEGGRAGG
jgi:DNA-binding transcriptional MerR regulator/methylmalonyl-CoA mutase cobalamin-binding subunit